MPCLVPLTDHPHRRPWIYLRSPDSSKVAHATESIWVSTWGPQQLCIPLRFTAKPDMVKYVHGSPEHQCRPPARAWKKWGQAIEKPGRRPDEKLARCAVTLSNPQASICLRPSFQAQDQLCVCTNQLTTLSLISSNCPPAAAEVPPGQTRAARESGSFSSLFPGAFFIIKGKMSLG